jgi:hypothetical protein
MNKPILKIKSSPALYCPTDMLINKIIPNITTKIRLHIDKGEADTGTPNTKFNVIRPTSHTKLKATRPKNQLQVNLPKKANPPKSKTTITNNTLNVETKVTPKTMYSMLTANAEPTNHSHDSILLYFVFDAARINLRDILHHKNHATPHTNQMRKFSADFPNLCEIRPNVKLARKGKIMYICIRSPNSRLVILSDARFGATKIRLK